MARERIRITQEAEIDSDGTKCGACRYLTKGFASDYCDLFDTTIEDCDRCERCLHSSRN